MSKANEPAFPTADQVKEHRTIDKSDTVTTRGGLTKLEHFAGLAMQGDWAAQDIRDGIFECRHGDTSQYSLRAMEWVASAKALLAELEKEQ